MMFADAPSFFASGVCVASALVLIILKNREVRARTEQISVAANMLEEHYIALEIFLKSDKAPAVLQEMLLWFSDASADKVAACALTKDILTKNYDIVEPSPRVNYLLEAMDNLCASDPHMFDVMQTCLHTGMMATFLRWKETSSMFQKLVTQSTISPRRELVLAASAAKYESSRHWDAGFERPLEPLAA